MNEQINTVNTQTDENIKDFMTTSKNIKEWNSNREHIKNIRDERWITEHLDASGLIKQCRFK